jgi:7-cyano-7-deazaguanine synthase
MSIENPIRETALVVLSGGMDSTTLAYLLHEGNDIACISFNYGQRHVHELDFAQATCGRLGVEHIVVDMSFMAGLLGGSALTDQSIAVPEGHYAEDTMKATVVPNRNMIMLSIAIGVATARNMDFVATGIHAGDHAVYPDCRPEFIEQMDQTARLATLGFTKPQFQVTAPFVHLPKDKIAEIGHSLNVHWDETWSCYKGGMVHCGKCGTCVERKEAFRLAEVIDPTPYDDEEFGVVAYRG